MSASDRCPRCDVDLDDVGSEVRCWKCGWSVRDVDNPHEYQDRADEVRYREDHRR